MLMFDNNQLNESFKRQFIIEINENIVWDIIDAIVDMKYNTYFILRYKVIFTNLPLLFFLYFWTIITLQYLFP